MKGRRAPMRFPIVDTVTGELDEPTRDAGHRRGRRAPGARGRQPHDALRHPLRLVRPRHGPRARGRERLLHRCTPARRWRWSANPAAASRRPAARSCGSSSRQRHRRVRRPGRARRSTARACASCASSMQMIFQDPFASLNPRMTVGARDRRAAARATGSRPRREARDKRRRAARARRPDARHGEPLPARILRRPAPAHLHRARARARAEADRRRRSGLGARRLDQGAGHQPDARPAGEMGLAYLFISHDMAVVERISHRVAVMYLGEIVEIGPRAAIFGNPQHPYTRRLMAAVPVARSRAPRHEARVARTTRSRARCAPRLRPAGAPVSRGLAGPRRPDLGRGMV